ncbi:hypothetical protein K0H02_05560 [Bacteroides fragilis]|nr:hypothetical protein [Bacteroides fragilis]
MILRNIILACVMLFTFPLIGLSQGFQKKAESETLLSFAMGSIKLNRITTDGRRTYVYVSRDYAYKHSAYLYPVFVGSREEAIRFFRNVIATMETIKKGDVLELGLPEGQTGRYWKSSGFRGMSIHDKITSSYTAINSKYALKMLEYLEEQE